MSFSSNVKEELSMLSTLNNKESVKTELIGYLISNNTSLDDKTIKFSTESDYNINRFSKLISNLEIKDYDIDIQGKVYTITVKRKKIESLLNGYISIKSDAEIIDIASDEVLHKSLVRGIFLGGGSINNPENQYHLEMVFKSKINAMYIESLLGKYDIVCKIINKKSDTSLYCKDGETISNILAFMGAGKSVLKFEEIRVVRDMRNNINRIVNCETANLNKTINASLKQIEDIKLIKEKNKFKNMPNNLQEIAKIRLENPEASLVELGGMLKEPVSKSGVNHRLKAISQIADEIRKSKEEGI